MATKVGKRRVDNGSATARFKPFEDDTHLETLVQFNLRGRVCGGYLLSKGKNDFRVVFGFDCQGIHTTLKEEQIDPVFDGLESGLKDLPPKETLTIHLGSFSDDRSRQQELESLYRNAPSTELQFLLMHERKRVQELTRQGIRKPKFLRLYVTYTVEADTENATDIIEKLLSRGQRCWKTFTGEIQALQYNRLENLLLKAFTDGFQLWEQILSNKMGLDIKPLSVESLWEQLWYRFNDTPPRPIPQLLVLDDGGLREEVYSSLSAACLLMESETSIPTDDRQWVHLKDKYIGALTFVDKPGGWPDKFQELRYLWEVIARDTVSDTEIYCQLSRANETLVKTNMQRLTKQSNLSAQLASEKFSIDVASQVKVRKSVAAQEQLYEGAVPLHTGVVLLVYRSSREQLNEACRYLMSCFRRPAWVMRETEYAWRVWLQTLPIVWENLMAVPFNRRLVYLSSEAPGLMPLVRTRSGDATGFELLAEEGGTPLNLDLFKAHKNLALFATTRAGKSVLVSGILTQALSHGMPVVAMDYPKPDGSSTFTDYTHFLGDNGAYFDIGTESNNLFEMPDLRSLSEEQQRERFEDYKGFLESALLAMIVGSRGNSGVARILSQTVRSILVLALNAFFNDPTIKERYDKAQFYGFGTPAWAQTPTLADFLEFCSPEHLSLDTVQGDIQTALQQIGLRLRFWLTSRVGRAISAPSSFRSDAQLLVFALRNLSDDEDAAILSLSAYSAALRRALSSPASIFFIDESPILFEFAEISALVGRLCANGAKAGVRVILSAQDPDTIAKSPDASKIFQNLSTRLIGRVQPSAVPSFVKILGYPQEIIGRNATESFFPKKEGIYSQWLLDDSGIYTYCRYYPGYAQLGAVANNPAEQAARTQTLKQYSDKLVGMQRFSEKLVADLRAS
jgi:hypothetical protein